MSPLHTKLVTPLRGLLFLLRKPSLTLANFWPSFKAPLKRHPAPTQAIPCLQLHAQPAQTL